MWPRIHANTKYSYLTLSVITMSCVEMLWLATLRVVSECQLLTFGHDKFFCFVFVSLGGVRLIVSPLGTSATVGYCTMIDDDYGAVGGMRIGRGNRSTRRKPAPVPLCPSKIPHDLTWD
jgi:hypothetical protein